MKDLWQVLLCVLRSVISMSSGLVPVSGVLVWIFSCESVSAHAGTDFFGAGGRKRFTMSQIKVNDLTFSYEGSPDLIFDHVSFTIDSSWKLGFIGRNGKGKTTFLNLLMGKYEYMGSIDKTVMCDYFPYKIEPADRERSADDLMYTWKPDVESWRVLREMADLDADPAILYRPVDTLSFGELTKVMLAVLFAGENDFLLIDEPTNHLDSEAREVLKNYLAGKSGFILVSHDRDLLDSCVDHVLVLMRSNIEVQSGNFSSWQDNKERADAFAEAENDKHLKEIRRLKNAMVRSQNWASKSESTKIGFDPVKEHDRSISARSYIGAKTKKMESRSSAFQKRMEKSIKEQEGLLDDLEQIRDLHIYPLNHYKDVLVEAENLTLKYADSDEPVISGLSFKVRRGDRVLVEGRNGCGKSTLIKTILASAGADGGFIKSSAGAGGVAGDRDIVGDAGDGGVAGVSAGRSAGESIVASGMLRTAPNLQISYISQDTSGLHGSLREQARVNDIDYSLFLTVLRQLAFEQAEFSRRIEDFSEGQKKKVLIATSLLTPAHIYIWDEPLNYVDVFSRMQLEKVIKEYSPTMLIVEHDARFDRDITTETIRI